MKKPALAVLDIDLIDVETGFNPRKEFDKAKMAELVASIRQSGIVSPPLVRPNGGSHFVLVAGERRLIAAKQAGLKEVPVLIGEKKGALAAAVAENLNRADLNPIEEAQALQRLADVEHLGTQKALSQRIGKSPTYIGERLRLLKLPAEVQSHIASGVVPVEAERGLRPVARISPRVAECACELVAKGQFKGQDLVTDLDEVLLSVAAAEFKDAPTMIDPRAIRLSDVIEDNAACVKLIERRRKAAPSSRAGTLLRLGEPEIDAARAAGCLIEVNVDHGGWRSSVSFLTDSALAVDLVERVIVRLERQAKKEANRLEKVKKQEPTRTGLTEHEKAQRERAQEVAIAQRFNEDLGRKLIQRRGSAGRKEHGLRRAKAVATALLGADSGLAGRGLRLVLPQLRETISVRGEKGKVEEELTYVDHKRSTSYLQEKVDAASSISAVIEVISEALIAAVLADQAAAPSVGYWRSPEREKQIEELLEPEIKAVRPVRSGDDN